MFKKLWNYELEDWDLLSEWPLWLRWIISLPFSFGAYVIFFWIVSLRNGFLLSEDTFIGAMFIQNMFVIVPLNLFFQFVPKYKSILSLSVAGLYYLVKVPSLIIYSVDLFYGLLDFRDFFLYIVPNLSSLIVLVFLTKILINSAS